MPRTAFSLVDVFGQGPFSGNPAAVVHDADHLSAEHMQQIARWFALPETAFLLRPTHPKADYCVRIFTPMEEFDFAGHPTLGAARAWLDRGGKPKRENVIVQECGSGLVQVRQEGDLMSFAAPACTRTGPLSDEDLNEVTRVLGIEPSDVVAHSWGVNGPRWMLLELPCAKHVRALRPGPVREGLDIGVVGLEEDGIHAIYEARSFWSGGEDPVTGSLHAALVQWLRGRGLIPSGGVAAQGSQVGAEGIVQYLDDGTQTWVGGSAVLRVSGDIDTPTSHEPMR